MPKLLDGDCRFDVVLESDAGKDPAPTFEFRGLTAREFMEAAELFNDNTGDDEDNLRRVFKCIRKGLVGWRNMGRDYDNDALEDLIQFHEGIELARSMMAGQSLGDDEAKN